MKDYFEHPEEIPTEVQEILDSRDYHLDGYKELTRITFALREIGWDMDWGLDADPYDLKPIK
jgi:hypothetical protein